MSGITKAIISIERDGIMDTTLPSVSISQCPLGVGCILPIIRVDLGMSFVRNVHCKAHKKTATSRFSIVKAAVFPFLSRINLL